LQVLLASYNRKHSNLMESYKQLILIILAAVVVFGYQWIKDEKKKNDYRKKYRRSQGWE